MSSTVSVCIIRNKGATSINKVINNADMIDDLVHNFNERLSLCQIDLKQLSCRLASVSEPQRKCLCYHSECRKTFANRTLIDQLEGKRALIDSHDVLHRDVGVRSLQLNDETHI